MDRDALGAALDKIDKPEDGAVADPNITAGADPNVGDPSKPAAEPGQQAGQPAAVQDDLDYKKDGRWGTDKMWKSEGDIYKSYKELEKMKAEKYDPMQKSYDALIKSLEDRGYSADKIDEILDEHKTFKDPTTVANKRSSYFQSYLDDGVYNERVIKFFEGLEGERMQAQFPGMSEAQIRKQLEIEDRLSGFESREQETQMKKFIASAKTELNDGMDKAKARSEKVGFVFTDDIRQKVVNYCYENKVPAKYTYQAFMSLYEDDLDKAANSKQELSTMEKLKKNKDGVIIEAGAGKPPPGEGKKSFRESIGSVFH